MGFVEDKDDIGSLPIRVTNNSFSFCFSIDGKRNNVIVCEEYMLFPSKDVRTWDNFKPKNPKFDPKTLQPFDRVLCRDDKYTPFKITYPKVVETLKHKRLINEKD